MNYSLKYNEKIKKNILVTGFFIILLNICFYSFLPENLIVQWGFNGEWNKINKIFYTISILGFEILFVVLSRIKTYKKSVIHLLIANIILILITILILFINLSR